MPIFRTRLFEDSPDQSPKPPYRARNWTATLRELTIVEKDMPTAIEVAKRQLFFGSIWETKKVARGKLSVTFSPEIIIDTNSKDEAQKAANIMAAAKCLLDGDFSCGELLRVIPDEPDSEYDPYKLESSSAVVTHGYALAAALAAKIAKSDSLTYAVSKYWLSLKTCSVASIEHHPRYGNQFSVERDPFSHATMALAIVAAYSVIEELGVAVKASERRPSKLPNGEWNPPVLDDLRQSLAVWGIDSSDEFVWLIRSSSTRIERKYPIPSGEKASWAGGHIRDRKLAIVDAIHYCGRLRSRVSAHGTSKLTRSLTMYHVINAQHLARKTLLQALGEWRHK